MKYTAMSDAELENELAAVKKLYAEMRGKGLKLDMSRGKPSPEQLDLSNGLFRAINPDNGFISDSGTDTRNYGGIDGLPEIKKLFGEILGVDPDLVIAGGCSSLNLMFDAVAQGMYKGYGGEKPWLLQMPVKFLCPVPGYDRHFAICEYLDIEMIPVRMDDRGPVISEVENLIKDPSVKGMWCVPKFSNPGGIVYSDDVVEALANLKPAAPDFKIFWDNAYAVHLLYDRDFPLRNIFECAKTAGTENMIIEFTSTSKITFAGAGVAAMASGEKTANELKRRLSFQTIGPDKTNHLRHARALPDTAAVEAQMARHAKILAPKFETVESGLAAELDGLGIARWNKPAGGYFISLFVLPGCARRVVELCRDAGLVLTSAGAAYPYGNDPDDSNIRIAPSFPSIDELHTATRLLAVCIKYAAAEKLCGRR